VRLRRAARTITVVLTTLLLSACAGLFEYAPTPIAPPVPDDTYHPPAVQEHPTCVERVAFTEEGEASWYGKSKKVRKTASGQILDPNGATAAHRYLPMGSRVKVTNLANGQTTNLTINDRGPFKRGRIIDVSQKSARDLGFLQQGVTRVRIEASETARSEC
jgi:rare lipoprotein A